MTHWIFGYGSLICPDSRERTGLTGAAIPVIVQGLERHWSVAVNYADLTVLGIRDGVSDAETGGVLFPLSDDDFGAFDRREVEYQRIPLASERIRPVETGASVPEGNIWVYLPEAQQSPHPIPQSYLDVALRGCLTVSEAFASHFLRNTHSWKERLDDRDDPLYPRPLKPEHRSVLPTVDALLARHAL